MRDSIVATDPKIGLAIRMPWHWPFAACRAVARCCPWAFGWPGVAFQRLDARLGVLGPGRPAMVVPPGARGKWQAGAAPGSTRGGRPQGRRRTSEQALPGLTADFGGTSSSITTGTSGAAALALAATTGRSASPRRLPYAPVVSAVAGVARMSSWQGDYREGRAASQTANANASHMTVCLLCRFPGGHRTKIVAVSPSPGSRRWAASKPHFGLVRGRLMALAGRPGASLTVGGAKRRTIG